MTTSPALAPAHLPGRKLGHAPQDDPVVAAGDGLGLRVAGLSLGVPRAAAEGELRHLPLVSPQLRGLGPVPRPPQHRARPAAGGRPPEQRDIVTRHAASHVTPTSSIC